MPSINMIAARRAEKRRQERNTQKLVYGILAEFGVVLIVTSVMIARIVATHNHIADLDDQIKSLQTKVDEIQELQTETAALQPKVNALTQAKTGTLYWYTAFDNLASSLGNDAWLSNIGGTGNPMATDPSGLAKLNVSGSARNQLAVGAAMLRMNAYPAIGQVTLNSVTQNSDPQHPLVSFQLVIQLKPAPAAPDGGPNVEKS